jgi:hypothetical protein
MKYNCKDKIRKITCSCKEQTHEITVEADYMADPFWCSNCKCNLDPNEIPVSDQLREELNKWMLDFQKVLFFSESGIETIDEEFKQKYIKRGMELTEEVKKELEGEFYVTYKPYHKIY